MARTRIELASSVLRKLGVIDAHSSPSAADSDYVIAQYDEMHAVLTDTNRAYWDADEIPLAVYQIIVRLVANDVAGAFGRGGNVEDTEARHQLILKDLIKHVARPASGLPAKAVHY